MLFDPFLEFGSEIHSYNTRLRKLQFSLSSAFSWSILIIARGSFLKLQYSIRSLTRFRFEKIDLPGTPQVWSSCQKEDKTLCNRAGRALVPNFIINTSKDIGLQFLFSPFSPFFENQRKHASTLRDRKLTMLKTVVKNFSQVTS